MDRIELGEHIGRELIKLLPRIDLVAIYGSTADGTFSADSDIDMYAISNDEQYDESSTLNLNLSINGVLVFPWETSWTDVEKMATGSNAPLYLWVLGTSNVEDARIAACRSDEAVHSFDTLRGRTFENRDTFSEQMINSYKSSKNQSSSVLMSEF